MNYSKKILDLSDSPKYRIDFILDNSVTIQLTHNKAKLRISFETIDIANEVCFDRIGYQTDLLGPYLGLLDGFVELMHKRPLEAIDRFPAKELDYYLRDDISVPSLSGFDEKFYEILAIGEEVKKSFFKIDRDHSPKLKRSFLEMSVSEQLEFIEEIFAYYIYNSDSEFKNLEIIDIELDSGLILFFESNTNDKLNLDELNLFLNEKLNVSCIVKILTY